MEGNNLNRRKFITALSATSLGAVVSASIPASGGILKQERGKLAILGGNPIREKGRIGPQWTFVDEQMIKSIVKTTRSGIWSMIQSGNRNVSVFESG